jgi:hypothetical protein
VNSKLTLNLGVRYEWSTPYTERFNRIQFSNFIGNSGININLSNAAPGEMSTQAALRSIGLNSPSSDALLGTTLFPTSGMRSVPVDRNNIGPRLGFAY